jgi:DNA-directed RNA polymerase specialized sigma subunit
VWRITEKKNIAVSPMKYEPTARQGASFYEILMQPFMDNDMSAPTDWELIDIVQEVFDTLDDADKEILNEIFFQQNTYEVAKTNIGIKAKSHAWRKTRRALNNLKKALLEHETFRSKYASTYTDNLG